MRRGTKRATAVLMVMTLTVAACGGDDDAEPAGSDATADETIAPPSSEADDSPAEQPSDDSSDASSGSDSGSSGNITSIDQIPERCRDLMADFLGELEPVVDQIDWENATIADFEQVADDFEQFSTEFDTESAAEECDDLAVDDDASFDLIIQFASDVAPGTVPFFEFISSMAAGVAPSTGDDAAADDNPFGGDVFEDCDDLITAMEDLMGQYDTLTDAPISELGKFATMGSVMMSCTPEQLAFFDSQEVTDFLGG